jgi:DNA-binding NtrC family response regulator
MLVPGQIDDVDSEDNLVEQWPHASVLVVDDEPGMRHFLARTLARRIGSVHTAGSAEEAEALLERHRFDLLIVDVALPGRSGIDLLRQLRERGNRCEAVLITAFADLDTAIEALRAGANDFLLKPLRGMQVISAVQRGLERSCLKRENWLLRRMLGQDQPAAPRFVGRSIVVKGLQSALTRLAGVNSTVLLSGESGTGKDLAAQALHALGPNASAPFVPVNCATLAPAVLEGELFGHGGGRAQRDGLFVCAQGGTLFLDEISQLPAALQPTLLRVLEDRHIRPVGSEHEVPVNVRVVAATNRPLLDEVEAGRFRKDLYYRLQVVELDLPPLRAHKEDIPDLVDHFIATLSRQLRVAPIEVTPAEMRCLAEYDWPGNVRELRNLIERSLIVGALNVSALYRSVARARAGSRPRAAAGDATDLQTLEKRHILAVLDEMGGDKARAARTLGISRRTLTRRLIEWNERPPAQG